MRIAILGVRSRIKLHVADQGIFLFFVTFHRQILQGSNGVFNSLVHNGVCFEKVAPSINLDHKYNQPPSISHNYHVAPLAVENWYQGTSLKFGCVTYHVSETEKSILSGQIRNITHHFLRKLLLGRKGLACHPNDISHHILCCNYTHKISMFCIDYW